MRILMNPISRNIHAVIENNLNRTHIFKTKDNLITKINEQ